jgi:UDP-glucuronate 4-epimerase
MCARRCIRATCSDKTEIDGATQGYGLKILVTGAAGFIGMHTALRLLERGDEVVGVDNLNDYYDPSLKIARLGQLQPHSGFRFSRLDVATSADVERFFAQERFEKVVHLAAQAGVRYSLQNPRAYGQSNLIGFLNILEGCRHNNLSHLVYASSSSVYGGNTKMPFSEDDRVDHPVSLYAATKKANELMAHTYSHLYQIPTTGLRFFTVYGPWGRPDMSPMLFASAIMAGTPINVFNHGRMSRDFTYVDDIVEGVLRVLDKAPPSADSRRADGRDSYGSDAPYRIFNIGNSEPVPLMEYIGALERAFGRAAVKNLLDLQPGDVVNTAADTSQLEEWVGFRPHTPLQVGIDRFVSWYRSFYL